MEKTLILIKPDAVSKKIIGKVIADFEEQKFRISAMKMIQLDESLLKEHYAHLSDQPFFPEIASFMQETPLVALILEGENVVSQIRDLLGATDPREAREGTLRKRFAESKMRNVCHASNSAESAKEEILRFFKPGELF